MIVSLLYTSLIIRHYLLTFFIFFFFSLCFFYLFFFFFSSRRRHTRSTRDWSSDVCSSDLELPSASYAFSGASASEGSSLGLPANTIAPLSCPLYLSKSCNDST